MISIPKRTILRVNFSFRTTRQQLWVTEWIIKSSSISLLHGATVNLWMLSSRSGRSAPKWCPRNRPENTLSTGQKIWNLKWGPAIHVWGCRWLGAWPHRGRPFTSQPHSYPQVRQPSSLAPQVTWNSRTTYSGSWWEIIIRISNERKPFHGLSWKKSFNFWEQKNYPVTSVSMRECLQILWYSRQAYLKTNLFLPVLYNLLRKFWEKIICSLNHRQAYLFQELIQLRTSRLGPTSTSISKRLKFRISLRHWWRKWHISMEFRFLTCASIKQICWRWRFLHALKEVKNSKVFL